VRGGFTHHSTTSYSPSHINFTQPEWGWEQPAPDCPGGHLSGYQPCATLLNFSDPSGIGAFDVLSPLACFVCAFVMYFSCFTLCRKSCILMILTPPELVNPQPPRAWPSYFAPGLLVLFSFILAFPYLDFSVASK
jgi:hypothetical protein